MEIFLGSQKIDTSFQQTMDTPYTTQVNTPYPTDNGYAVLASCYNFFFRKFKH